MSVYIDPVKLTYDQRVTVADWLRSEGCRDSIPLMPIWLDGKIVTYVSAGREGREFRAPMRFKRMRVRTQPPRFTQEHA